MADGFMLGDQASGETSSSFLSKDSTEGLFDNMIADVNAFCGYGSNVTEIPQGPPSYPSNHCFGHGPVQTFNEQFGFADAVLPEALNSDDPRGIEPCIDPGPYTCGLAPVPRQSSSGGTFFDTENLQLAS